MNKYNCRIESIRVNRKGYWIRVAIYQKYKDCIMYEGRMYIDATLDIEGLKEIFKGGIYNKENRKKLSDLGEK